MSRAVFIPSPIDPFVLLNCLHYFNAIWQDEVDKLYICLNSDVELSVVNELLELLKHPKIVVSYYNHILGHGQAINKMIEQCDEDNILLLEDDSIIFKKGVVDSNFRCLETGACDLIGSPRTSCNLDLAKELCNEFGLDLYKWGDAGPNFWPCFLWVKKSDLLKTDREFGNTKYGDTFVWASIQLRRMGLRVLEIPQYHLKVDDLQYKDQGLSIFDGQCGYMHIGSLSSGIENTLLDINKKPLKERTKDVPPVELKKTNSDMEKLELERRVLFWLKAFELNEEKFGAFGEAYSYAIENVVRECNLSWASIDNLGKMYYNIING